MNESMYERLMATLGREDDLWEGVRARHRADIEEEQAREKARGGRPIGELLMVNPFDVGSAEYEVFERLAVAPVPQRPEPKPAGAP